VGVTRDVNMVVVNKGNVGDGNIVHKAIASYTSLVDKALIDNVVETRDMDMLVVDNVVNSNGIVIKENDNPSFDSKNENDLENQVNPYGNETDMGSETESDESERSFDYLSDCDHEVVKLRKRKSASKNNIDKGVENASTEHEDFRPPTRNYDIGDGDTIK
ncbi:hypothetical protein Tco_0931471, partial [Tanacetum coccineum]